MSDCGTHVNLDYELQMVTNMTTEIQTQLSMAADIRITQALRAYLAGVFSDYAHDVDLGFYDVVPDETGDWPRLQHQSHIMDANQSSYILYIPIRKYMHLAVANLAENGLVSLRDYEYCHQVRLEQEPRDTIPSHKTGLFTARKRMEFQETLEDQQVDVNLYMANCGSSIIIDTVGSGIRDMRVYASGFATAFEICDSSYVFSHSPVVVADKVELEEEEGCICFSAITFPSRDPSEDAKAIIETEDPFISDLSEDALWEYRVYTTLADGTVTESLLGVFKPLRAGQFTIIKARVQRGDGAVIPGDATVGVSITTHWKEGMEHVVPL